MKVYTKIKQSIMKNINRYVEIVKNIKVVLPCKCFAIAPSLWGLSLFCVFKYPTTQNLTWGHPNYFLSESLGLLDLNSTKTKFLPQWAHNETGLPENNRCPCDIHLFIPYISRTIWFLMIIHTATANFHMVCPITLLRLCSFNLCFRD